MREYRVWMDACVRGFVIALAGLGSGIIARADISTVIESMRESQFRFARQGSEVPFVATSWAQARFYSNSDFESLASGGGDASFSEQVYNQGVLYPAYVGARDMFIVGESVTFDRVEVKADGLPDQEILTLTPIAAWLRQFDRKNLGAVFVAPMFSRQTARHGDWGTNVFAGALGMHWHSDTLQWAYGAIYENSFGKNYFYPYGGFIWAPAPKWSLAALFPWPTLAYAPRERWLLTLGAAPGGSAWRATKDGVQTTYSFYTWTVSAGAAWRFSGKFWLYAGAGVSGLRSFDLSTRGGDAVIKTKPGTVFTLAIQLRP